jgi:hypothetical protein
MRRYFLLRSGSDKCVTIWSRRFAVTALDGDHEKCNEGDPFSIYRIKFLNGIDANPKWNEQREWKAKVVVVDKRLRLIVLELLDGARFEMDMLRESVLEWEKKFPAQHRPMSSDIPCYNFGVPFDRESDPWMFGAVFGLAPKFYCIEILKKPVSWRLCQINSFYFFYIRQRAN